MEWLLTYGNEVAVPDYQMREGHYKASRTGEALMFKVNNYIGWKVPEAHAGTIDDNWITKIINEFIQETNPQTVLKEFAKVL